MSQTRFQKLQDPVTMLIITLVMIVFVVPTFVFPTYWESYWYPHPNLERIFLLGLGISTGAAFIRVVLKRLGGIGQSMDGSIVGTWLLGYVAMILSMAGKYFL